jgi:hypothetical protein
LRVLRSEVDDQDRFAALHHCSLMVRADGVQQVDLGVMCHNAVRDATMTE